jgi:hypothetical protein
MLMGRDSWKLTKYEQCIMSDEEVKKENAEMQRARGQGISDRRFSNPDS